MKSRRRTIVLSILVLPVTLGLFRGPGDGPLSIGTAVSADHGDEKEIRSRQIDWGHPIINGVSRARPENAGADLEFPPSAPGTLGDPQRVLVTAPQSAARVDRVLSMEYNHPHYGRFLVIQSINETNDAELAIIAARCLPKTRCEGETSMEQLRNRQLALLIQGPTATSITWLRGVVRFDVVGPSDTFTPESARKVANSF